MKKKMAKTRNNRSLFQTNTNRSKKTKQSRLSFIFQHKKAALFVLFFVIVGTTLLVMSRADDGFGSIPTGANKIVVQYQKGMPHPLKENDFNVSMPPRLLLYADGTMLCGDGHSQHGAASDAPATFRKRDLNARDTKAVFNRLLRLGMKKTAEKANNSEFIEPAAVTDTIILNSTTGAYYATKPQSKADPDFDKLRAYLEQQCAATTQAYTPDDASVETAPAPAGSQPVADLSDVVGELVPQNLGLNRLGLQKVTRNLTGNVVRSLRQRIQAGTANVYRLNGKLVKARLLPNIPNYEYPQPLAKKGKNSASAQPARTTRWLYVIPADGQARGNEQSRLTGIAGSLRDYYTRHTGRPISISQIAVVRGSKTAGQYQQCPSGANCNVNWGNGPVHSPTLASYHNLQREFKQEGVSTNVIYQHATSEGCVGWGGPVAGQDSAQFSFGFAATSDGGCNWNDAIHTIPAHEMGHSFGLVHTCDATLMGSCGHQKAAWPNVPLHSGQANFLATHSPYFVEAPKATVQGIKSVGTGNGQSTSPELNPVDIVYLDGAGWGSNRDADRHKGIGEGWYSYANIPQGYHRFGVDKIPAGWEIIGYTVCYDRTDCHAQNPQAMQPNPLSHYHGAPSVVINTQGKKYADLWFHFRKKTGTPPPSTPTNNPGSKAIKGVASGRCIDVPRQNFNKGVKVQLWDCNGTAAQAWTQQGNKALVISNNKCLDVPQQNFNNGVEVQIWDCNGTIAQVWTVHSDGTIRTNNNKCLDAYYGGTSNGTKIILWDCHGGNNQRWTGLSVNADKSSGGGGGGGTTPPPVSTDPNANFKFATTVVGYKDSAYKQQTTVTGSTTKTINFSWSGAPVVGVQPDYYIIGWQGTFTAPASGTYTFYSEQDDGFALRLGPSNAPLLIDKWNKPGPTGQGSMNLTKGQRIPIAVAAYDLTGPGKARLYWSGPGITGKPLFPNLK